MRIVYLFKKLNLFILACVRDMKLFDMLLLSLFQLKKFKIDLGALILQEKLDCISNIAVGFFVYFTIYSNTSDQHGLLAKSG